MERAPPLFFLLVAAGPCFSILYSKTDGPSFTSCTRAVNDACLDTHIHYCRSSVREVLMGVTGHTSKAYFLRLYQHLYGYNKLTQVLLLVIRIMDDVKDYEKDKVVHPDRHVLYYLQHATCNTLLRRPLPRGLIKFEEVTNFINIAMASTVVYGVLLGLRFGSSVGISYEVQVTQSN